jgi:ribose 5-phosphate isomerase B
MRVALASDEATPLTDAIDAALRERGYEAVHFGALRAGEDDAWTSMARAAGEAVASGSCTFGIVCCWSGTGASIAANKVPGVRAALCCDAITAKAAREWNDANVLALSLRATSIALAREMLDAWFATPPTTDPKYAAMIETLRNR